MSGLATLRDFWGSAVALGPDAGARWSIFWSETKNVRVRLGLARHDPARVYALDTVYGRLHFRDNFGDITNLPNLLYRQVYRTDAPVGDGAILDVGANIGLAAAWFRHRYPHHAIHCFEPLEENARLIPLNCPGAHVQRVAVGRVAGQVELAVDADAVMASTIPYTREAGRRTLPVITLDEYVAGQGIARVALLKIDTEGMELDVLGGAERTLSQTGVVGLETHGRDRHDAVLALLRARGFTIDREAFDGSTGLVFASRGGAAGGNGARPS
jgi:FkbM family methyltransferase